MFITKSGYKSPMSSMFATNGDEMWEATELALQQIWFVVNLEIKDDEEDEFACFTTLFVTDFKTVEPLLQSGQDGKSRLSSVQIVTPSNLNNKLHWSMEPLKAVLEGREKVGKQELSVYIFETVSGKKYPGSFCSVPLEELGAGTLMYQLPH
jgi:hypothetical protein